MTGNEIRQRFLQYFKDRGHTLVESSSLVPHDDPTLLFTNAGMVQFKRVFMGEEQRDYVRAASAQRCVRAGGKHNDLENVGHTARHHTFFEMLGNFSFGDYFKKEAIGFAWEFLTRELGLDPGQLWVSVFEEDDEAYRLWEQIEDLPPGRIVRLGEADNFWAMGDTGPCGPCSEIHIDQGVEAGCGRPECAVGCDCDRFLELWNLVFMQFYRDASGTMTPLPKPSIDTGMGLERIAAVLQGKLNNFDSDLFAPLIASIATLSGRPYQVSRRDDVAMRVIADHARATTFLVADGVLPANEGRGYVLRRIMRRAIRFGRLLGLTLFFSRICDQVIDTMAAAYPHLQEARHLLDKVVSSEEHRFGATLDRGLELLDQEIDRLARTGENRIAGEFIFRLYDTYGFPVDIVRDVAQERDLKLDEVGFRQAMARQQEQSRRSWKGVDVAHLEEGVVALLEKGHQACFTGYSDLVGQAPLEMLLNAEGQPVARASVGDHLKIFCTRTPFYAEAGGQVGDQGTITTATGRFAVQQTTAPANGIILHEGNVVEGQLEQGQEAQLTVTRSLRRQTACHHTATHLLHAALRQVLGNHIKQAGSLVSAQRLRFDFTHFSPVTPAELEQIEQVVNQRIRENIRVNTEMQSRESAIAAGATALFGEKYGETVRVVTVGDFSKELCGGTHTRATGDIGLFKILGESGIAAGVRRIEAVTGEAAIVWLQALNRDADRLCQIFSCSFSQVKTKVEGLLRQQKEDAKEIRRLTAAMALADLDRLLDSGQEVEGIQVIAGRIDLDSPKTLREVGDRVRDRMGSGVAVLGGSFKGKGGLLALVSKDLTGRIQAGALISQVAAIIGGKGGGRPDMAQAGAPLVDKLDQALEKVPQIVSTLLSS